MSNVVFTNTEWAYILYKHIKDWGNHVFHGFKNIFIRFLRVQTPLALYSMHNSLGADLCLGVDGFRAVPFRISCRLRRLGEPWHIRAVLERQRSSSPIAADAWPLPLHVPSLFVPSPRCKS